MHNFPEINNVDYFVVNKKLTKVQENQIYSLALQHGIDFDTENRPSSEYPYLCYYYGELHSTHLKKEQFEVISLTFDQFKAFVQGKGKKEWLKLPFSETIKLNENHEVIVTKKEVKVGCQKFTHQTIKQLYLASQKAQKS